MTIKVFNVYMDYNEHKTKRNLLSSFKSQKEFIDFVNQYQPIGAKNFKDAMRDFFNNVSKKIYCNDFRLEITVE